jgi:hypothetical protein
MRDATPETPGVRIVDYGHSRRYHRDWYDAVESLCCLPCTTYHIEGDTIQIVWHDAPSRRSPAERLAAGDWFGR